jgi:DNA-binding XRE family transcriptional regulator
MTLDDLASEAGCKRLTVYRVERGMHASEHIVRSFCRILEVPLENVLNS